jgi:ribosomal protein L35
MKLKTHKTVSKRLKLTRKGKLLKRKGGQGHFNSRESGTVTRNKRRDLEVSEVYVRNLKSLMPHAHA